MVVAFILLSPTWLLAVTSNVYNSDSFRPVMLSSCKQNVLVLINDYVMVCKPNDPNILVTDCVPTNCMHKTTLIWNENTWRGNFHYFSGLAAIPKRFPLWNSQLDKNGIPNKLSIKFGMVAICKIFPLKKPCYITINFMLQRTCSIMSLNNRNGMKLQDLYTLLFHSK